MRHLARGIDVLSALLGYLSGASFLILSLYITYDALARSFGLPFSGITDEIAAYVLAVGGTWAMAKALQVGSHVRIDIIVGLLNPTLRWASDLLAAATTAGFAGLLALYAWRQALEAHALGTRSITMLQAPLAIPQGMVALGFSLLAIQAVLMFVRTLAERPGRTLPVLAP